MADRDWKISFNMFQLNNGYFQGRTVNLPEGIVDLLIYLLKVVMFNCFLYVYQRVGFVQVLECPISAGRMIAAC